ncbi:GNAT family N-acetyltransferase [Ruminiclostridium josui]|uniref:GNAT family N-acetyltransferase n=1 Tax=Ruminiclostridium josui TaxID=1499 RepID=UPI000463F067
MENLYGGSDNEQYKSKESSDFGFENTEIQRLWTKVDVRNIASCRMLEKCGYTKEGLIRQGKMVNTWCDYYIYGILSSDMKPR